jgi:hypothetical protein
MSQYDRQVKQAIRMIKKYGQVVTWNARAENVDSSQPWKSTEVGPTPYPVSIVFLRNSGSNGMNAIFHLMKGTDIPEGAPQGIMASVPFTPNITDTIDRNGVAMKVVSIDPVAPGGIPILYRITFA